MRVIFPCSSGLTAAHVSRQSRRLFSRLFDSFLWPSSPTIFFVISPVKVNCDRRRLLSTTTLSSSRRCLSASTAALRECDTVKESDELRETGVKLASGEKEAANKNKAALHPGGKVHLRNGLPVMDIALPSRRENCQFILRPMSDTVGSLIEELTNEDSGIEVVTFYTPDGLRISKSTKINHLLTFSSFHLRINDTYYNFDIALFDSPPFCSTDNLTSLNEVKARIASLYTVLDVDEYKMKRENQLLASIEQVERRLRPMAIVRLAIEKECEKHVERVFWAGFSAICFKVGVFARLTWWEYSWDIMEPITYFSTFSTVVIALAYYIVTRQNFEYSSAHLRILAKDFHRRARKYNFDANIFNNLQRQRKELNLELKKLRDPLFQHLPLDRLHVLESSTKNQGIS